MRRQSNNKPQCQFFALQVDRIFSFQTRLRPYLSLAELFGPSFFDHYQEYLQQIGVSSFTTDFVLKDPTIISIILQTLPEILSPQLIKLSLSFQRGHQVQKALINTRLRFDSIHSHKFSNNLFLKKQLLMRSTSHHLSQRPTYPSIYL